MSKLSEQKHTAEGFEIMDPTPMQPPLGYKKTLSLAQQIQQQVRLAKLAMMDELHETEDEADDFVVGDDFEPTSPHENGNVPTLASLKKKAQEINKAIEKAKREAAIEAYKKTLKTPATPPAQPTGKVNDAEHERLGSKES